MDWVTYNRLVSKVIESAIKVGAATERGDSDGAMDARMEMRDDSNDFWEEIKRATGQPYVSIRS